MGFYIDVTKVEAPSKADPGQTVSVRVTVKNKSTTITQFVLSMAGYDTTYVYASPEYVSIAPQGTYTFILSFMMPPMSIVVSIWTFIWVEYPDQPGYWYNDDARAITIEATLALDISQFKIADYIKV